MKKLKILFLCTGNSCRSQMAEGLTNYFKSDIIEAFSAGIEMHGLNSNAVKVMEEIGINISNQKSKSIKDVLDIDFDFVITVCKHAHETCPIFPKNSKVVHYGFDDPPFLSKNLKGEKQILDCYRKVRDEIKSFVMKLPDIIYF